MYRTLRSTPLRSVAESLCSSKSNKHGRNGTVNRTDCSCSRSINTLTGNEFFGCLKKSTTKTAQIQIVNALHFGERHTALDILSDFVHRSSSLKADDFVDILNYCARSPDPLFVMETWRVMDEKNIGLDSLTLLLMVRSLCRGGYLDEALHLIDFSGDRDHISPVLPVYNCFLGACAKMKSMIHADKCLEFMDRRMVGKNEITYSELLKLAVFQQNLAAVQEIWKDYIKHYSLSLLSLRKFIWSFTRLGDLMSAYEALQHMVALALRGKLFLRSNTKGRLRSSRLDIPIPSNDGLELQTVDFKENRNPIAVTVDLPVHYTRQTTIAELQNREIENHGVGLLNKHKSTLKVLRWSFSDVIHACGQARNSELAEQLMLQMQNLGLQPSSHTYDGFARAIVSERGYSGGMELLKMMWQQNLKPYDPTFATLSISFSKALELDLAEGLLDQISECPYPYPYNTLLAACDTMDQPERAIRVLAKMKQLKLQPDIRTYELLFSLFGNMNAPYEEGNMLSRVHCAKRINAIEMDMAKNGVQHSHASMMNLLKALGEEGMIREMIQYSCLAENLFSHQNTYLGTPIYNIVLHSLVEAKESNMAIEIFKSMKSCGFPPDAATYNIMIDCCNTIQSFKSACALVSMMIRDGYTPVAVTFTTLIKILLEYENFDKALNLLDQARLEEVQLDVLSYNTILQKACGKQRIDVIEYVIERIHQEKIQPDPTTCHFVFTAYVEQGFHATALEALNILSLRMLGKENNDTFQEQKTEFEENFILAEDPEAETRIIQFFKDSEVNLYAALLNLRWCAILGFPISWSENQSSWAKRLSTNCNNINSTTQ